MKQPGFYIEHSDWTKILHYARARQSQEVEKGAIKTELNHEIGGMLIAKLDKDNDWILQDPVILKQETSGGNCTLDKESLADYYIEMAEKHGKKIQFVWWHSHAKMDAFWSRTDKNTMKEYSSGQWSMFLVVNVEGKYQFRIQMWQPIVAGEDIELGFVNAPDNSIPKDIIKEVKEKCSEETYSNYGTGIWQNRRANTYNNNQLSLHSNTYGTDSQRDIWAEKQELKDHNASFGIYDDEELAYGYMSRKIDDLNSKLCTGEMKHNAYRKAIKELNKKIAAGAYDFKIKIPSQDKALDAFIQSHFPHDFIVDKDTDMPYSDVDIYGGSYA